MLALLSMANKKAGSLTDTDLASAAQALGGEQSDGLAALFRVLRDAEPDAKVADLLSTPSANTALRAVVDRLSNATENKEGGIYCRCPNCNFPFITE